MQTQDQELEAARASGSPVILLVEDDAAICDMYCLALRIKGYAVVSAETAGGALETASRLLPDLILLDIGLPDRPGTDVLLELKAAPQTAAIPVLMLTNYSEPDIVSRALEGGAAAYIVKAETTPAQVVNAVANLVAQR